MKKMYLLFAVVFAFTGCNCQKNTVESGSSDKVAVSREQLPKLEYVANTRGFYQKITIENQRVTVSSDRNNADKGETAKISDADAKELAAAFQKLNLRELPTYKDPTQKRFYDGAAIANLKVTHAGTTYQTVDFDHGFPPVEIAGLVDKIVSFGKNE